MSDEVVLERAREGQELEFAELYRRFHGLVYGYCLARLMDPAAAEDVAQETFLRINRSRATEPIHSARAWIFTVARSAVIDHVRRVKRMPDSLPVDDDFEVAALDSDAADGMLRREDAKLVFLALARLRPRYRSALVLREMHGLSSAEIGESLELKPGAVDTLVCRARDAFGREYAELSGLPSDCRRAVEYIYRDRGSGIENGERAWLTDHVSGCPRCARERTLAADPKRLAVLLPLAGIRPEGLGILQRALETLGNAPASFEALGLVSAKVTAVAVAATIAAVPIAGRIGGGTVQRAERTTHSTPSTNRTTTARAEMPRASHVATTSDASVVASSSADESAAVPTPPGAATVVVEPADEAVPPDVPDELLGESEPSTPPVSAAGSEGPSPSGDTSTPSVPSEPGGLPEGGSGDEASPVDEPGLEAGGDGSAAAGRMVGGGAGE